jgi:phosphodiesterase/alkaline phosphatase D-like protein
VSHFPIRETLGPARPPYRAVRLGSAVELFILDTRSYRSLKYTCCNAEGMSAFVVDDVDDTTSCIHVDAQQDFATANCLSALSEPSRTILGAAQRGWLEGALLASTATFKLVVGGPPMMELIVDRYDRWEGWPTERAEILNFIQGNDLANVIWLSTDMRGMFVADVRVDATHRVPEVVNGTFGTDTWIRSVFPERLLPFLELGVVPSLVTHVTAWEGDRSLVAIVTIDPHAVPPAARFDFVDRTGAVVRSHGFAARE